jgi:hypothetical protein
MSKSVQEAIFFVTWDEVEKEEERIANEARLQVYNPQI